MEGIRTNEGQVNEVEKLQHEMIQRVASMHSVAFSGPEEELKGNTLRNAQMQEQLFQLEGLYRKIPEGYHLDIQITPQAYYRLGAEKNLWLRKEVNQGKSDYLLRVGKFADFSDNLEPDRTVLNIVTLGSPGVMARFGLQEVSRELRKTGESVRPQDILNMNIKQNHRK